ncbi:hypothetical protein ACFZBP_02235 [Streptomyces sp. NPDC008086]|uniref:hypothetical protein n=1 Tax=Streptomyces sp. NPDC008086 TaxID=3364807 RepID=UPI0036E712F0
MLSSPTSAASAPPHTFRTVFPVLALCWLSVFFDGMDVNMRGAVWGFTAFALAGLVGAVAISLVPLARRTGRTPASARTAVTAPPGA